MNQPQTVPTRTVTRLSLQDLPAFLLLRNPVRVLPRMARKYGDVVHIKVGRGETFILSHPDDYNNRFYQGFIVLNYCRMLHDLQRVSPGSKLAGAQWAKAKLDPFWNGLIDRSWNGRPDPAVSVRQPADPNDFQETLEFINYCRSKVNT